MADLTTISNILKTAYGPAVVEQLDQECVIYNRVEKNRNNYNGKNFTFPIHTGRNEGVGAASEGGTLPTYGAQSYGVAVVPVKYLYGTLRVSGPSVAASKGSNSYGEVLKTEMMGLTKNLKEMSGRIVFGDGTAALTVCGTTSNSTTVVVSSTAKMHKGQRIDVLVTADGTTGTGAAGRYIVSISSATAFVISGAAITTDNTFSVYAAGGRIIEPIGLEAIVATTDTVTSGLHGLAVASYPEWAATVTASGGTLTEIMMQKMIDDIEIAGSGSPSAIYTTHSVLRAYMDLLSTQKMFVNTQTLKGGVKAPSFNDLPIIADKNCPSGYMYFIDESNLEQEILKDWHWLEADGGTARFVSGVDAIEAVYARYAELACLARNAHGKLTGITGA
jgi:hypothetical protein